MSRQPPIRVRLAILSDRWFKKSVASLFAVHRGLWLGVLDSEDLNSANAAYYAVSDLYRSEEHNRSGLTDWEQALVEKHFPRGTNVLVPSAGAGREVIGLDALGYTVVGCDPSPDLVEVGRSLLVEEGSSAQLLISPADRLPESVTGPFDEVLVGWGGYTHIRGRDARVAFLAELRALLEEEAPMILSFMLRGAEDRRFRLTVSLARAIHRLRRSDEPVELGDTVSGTFDHFFTWEEVESELALAGFAVVETSSAPYPHLLCKAE